MENTGENKLSLYKRFMNSKAFYPVVLGLIAALCVSIWAINRSNRLMMTTSPISQNTVTAGDFLDEPTTAIQNTTAKSSTTAAQTQKPTYAYESNRAGKGKWVMPVGGNLGKDYSAGTLVKSATMGDWRVHDGIDIIAKKGTQIHAVNSGKVLEVYNDAFWGTVVVIDHGGEVTAKYCGLGTETKLNVGDVVEKGAVLGSLATVPCEQKDESHLHFEVKVAGEVQDPIAVMNMQNEKE